MTSNMNFPSKKEIQDAVKNTRKNLTANQLRFCMNIQQNILKYMNGEQDYVYRDEWAEQGRSDELRKKLDKCYEAFNLEYNFKIDIKEDYDPESYEYQRNTVYLDL